MTLARADLLPPLDRRLRPVEAHLPERVLQFGEGNFLRAFVDWMLERMNRQGVFSGRAVLVQPIASGMADALNGQDGLYTVVLRGLERGRARGVSELVSSVSRCLNPYTEFDAFIACAENPDLRFVVSNTTEAGIATDPDDRLDARPAKSFPGKLVQLLYARFRHFQGDPQRGLVMLPCELIENNGRALGLACRETAERFELPTEFLDFLANACTFTSTLVDRIVTGYPRQEAGQLSEKLGYEDRLLVAGELFHSWVIQGPEWLEAELPLRSAGLNVTWTSDVRPYRERKVRILNGAHTMLAPAAYLAGKDTVRQCMQDPLFRDFVERGIHDEILPTLKLPREELLEFAAAVVERFDNPFIEHQLSSIALNSVSKYRARILETIADHLREQGTLPPRLTFAMAALMAFYRGERPGERYALHDEPAVVEFFGELWQSADSEADLVRRTLARTDFWGRDLNLMLPGFALAVTEHLSTIRKLGARAAIERFAQPL